MITRQDLKADIAFLLAREAMTNRDVGKSSNALVRFAYTGQRPSDWEFPRDTGDFERCRRTRLALPRHRNTHEVDLLMLEFLRVSRETEAV
jgi:hypothetical protein